MATTVIQEWRYTRKTTRETLQELSQCLHGIERTVNVTNITTSAIGIPIGITSVVSGILFLMAPATGGVSAWAGAVLAASGVAGTVVGAIGLLSNLSQYGIKKNTIQQLDNVLRDDILQTARVMELLNIISREKGYWNLEDMLYMGKALWKTKNIVTGTYDVIQSGNNLYNVLKAGEKLTDAALDSAGCGAKIIEITDSAIDSVASVQVPLNSLGAEIADNVFDTAANTFSKAPLKVIGVIGSGISITFDAYQLVTNAVKLHNGSRCELGNKIDVIVDQLEENTGIVNDMYHFVMNS